MWSPKPKLRALALVSGIFVAAMAVSACSFTPLYGTEGQAIADLQFAYATPNTRLEQVIYQDLALRMGSSTLIDANRVSVSASNGARRVGRTSSGSPATTYEMTITATIKVTSAVEFDIDDEEGAVEKVLFTTTRKASATYTTNGQRLTDDQALDDAVERAALAVAQSLRLTTIAALKGK